jgi:phage tail sheath protein FI
MPFQLSPGVAVTEKDFTSIIPAVATSAGAFAGAFQWGPVLDPVRVTSENELVRRFGKPTDTNAQSFFTAANFLAYSNNLLICRGDATAARNAVSTQTGGVTAVTTTAGGSGSGYTSVPTVTFSAPDVAGVTATGTAVLGTDAAAQKVVSITITNAGTGYTTAPTITFTGGGGSSATATATISTGGIKINNENSYTTTYANGAGAVGEFAAKYPGALGNSLKVSMSDASTFSTWAYKAEFDTAPGTSSSAAAVGGSADELHIIVIDEDGLWTGVQGAILEKFSFVSKANDAKRADGSNNYYKDVLNNTSEYIWWMDHPTAGTNWGTSSSAKTFASLSTVVTKSLSGGVDSLTLTAGEQQTAYAIYADDATYDIALIPMGKATTATTQYVIDNVAEVRLDCIVFASPQDTTTGDVIVGAGSAATTAINLYRDGLSSTSYAVLDSGYKYQYDRYNDVYRWIPLNGDVAGTCARTDNTNDPWFSPGGLNRGQIKNVVKLAHNPSKTDRDVLYKNGVNPVVTFPGQGTVLFGDKTLLAKPSAFDRINVRRLFIVLEKSIATAARFQLFEFNDGFTRAQFKNLVEPFLRDVQGRRGITDFVVKCDETNNTGQVIDANEFVADIFVKPNRSINYITLNFVAARSSINFSEVGA